MTLESSTSTPLALKWPTNIKELFLFPYEQTSINAFVQVFDHAKENYPNYVPVGKAFTHNNEEKELLYRLVFLYSPDKKITHIILPLGDPFIIGKGKDRIVKKCYDLVHGCFFVKKKYSALERTILLSLKGQQGIPEIYGFYEKNNKIWGIEKLYSTLTNAIQDRTLGDLSHKLHIILDLLKAVTSLHSMGHTHSDIKPANINLTEDGAVLSDYGNADLHHKLYGGMGFHSPEVFVLLGKFPDIKKIPEKTLIQFNKSYGKGRDVWALGLVFGSILKSYYPNNSCIFTFTKEALSKIKTKNNCLDYSEVRFEKGAMEKEFEALKKADPLSAQAYIIIEKMLAPDPSKRLTASKALQEFDQLTNQEE